MTDSSVHDALCARSLRRRPETLVNGCATRSVPVGRRAQSLLEQSNWTGEVFETGAMPHFELPDAFVESHDAFLERPMRREA